MRRAVRSTKGSIGAARSLQDFLGAPEAMSAQDRSLHQEPLEPQEPSGPPQEHRVAIGGEKVVIGGGGGVGGG